MGFPFITTDSPYPSALAAKDFPDSAKQKAEIIFLK